MARRSAQSVLKRAREQALREKRELKKAKKDARAAERRGEVDPSVDLEGTDPTADAEDTDPTLTAEDTDAGEAAG